jgi:hypothetical protein
MFDQLFSMFTGSRQGQQAIAQLGAQGYSPQQAHGILGVALPAAHQAMQAHLGGQGQGPGLLNVGDSNYVMNFLGGAVSGLIRGEGFGGAAVDGLQGVVGGHVAQVIAGRFGLPQRTAGLVGSVVTPLMIDFLWEKFQGTGFGGAQAQAQAQAQQPQPGAFGQPQWWAQQQPQYGQPQYAQPFTAPPGAYNPYGRS